MVNGTRGKTIQQIQKTKQQHQETQKAARLNRLLKELACGVTHRRMPNHVNVMQEMRENHARKQKHGRKRIKSCESGTTHCLQENSGSGSVMELYDPGLMETLMVRAQRSSN